MWGNSRYESITLSLFHLAFSPSLLALPTMSDMNIGRMKNTTLWTSS